MHLQVDNIATVHRYIPYTCITSSICTMQVLLYILGINFSRKENAVPALPLINIGKIKNISSL